MRTYDFSPFYRSTVGFDRLFDALDSNTNRPEWPPYDIERKGENDYRISMAVAGFAPTDIELVQQGNTLQVTGQKREEDQRVLLHRGIAFRNFKQTFNLADHVKVASANLENGLLTVDLVREVPEQLKPRRIDIATREGSKTIEAKDKQPEQDGLSNRKAA